MDGTEPDEGYRNCATCGGDCEPAIASAEGVGVRVVFSCPMHGVQALVDPFDDLR